MASGCQFGGNIITVFDVQQVTDTANYMLLYLVDFLISVGQLPEDMN